MISYLLPTRNRPRVLARTLRGLGALPGEAHAALGGGEVIVIDNASTPPARADTLPNGMPLRVLRREANEGAAARNAGAAEAAGDWLVMLDDDSYPIDAGHLQVIAETPPDVAAIGADIRLPDGSREAGGLPEVFVGCGAAVRRDAFLDVGGYDPAFGFYAEEYDLCARLLLSGGRVRHDLRFRVMHRKVAGGRDMNLILRNLVRNNVWVMQRYAPQGRRQRETAEIIARYGRIAVRESAAEGYAAGMEQLFRTRERQPCTAMSDALFDRFTGKTHAAATLAGRPDLGPGNRVAVVEPGKNEHIIRETLDELGVEIVDDERAAEAVVIGTLSPGPMLDAWERRAGRGGTVICPWAPFDRAHCGPSAEPVYSSSESRARLGRSPATASLTRS